MRKNKILLLFPDGVGIRNYLYSDVFKNTEAELILFHNFDDETAADVKKLTGLSQAFQIPKYNESLKEKFLRELICLSRLYRNSNKTGNPSILTNWNRDHKSFSKKVFYKAIEITAPFIKKYDTILALESFYQKAIRGTFFYKEVKEILEKVQPDMLFCSHQRGLQCATIFAAAADLGIETSTVIYSWDNLPKARMALRADKYLVWSDYMKKEVELYYPEFNQTQVVVTGTPQFECYESAHSIIPKDFFYDAYGLDCNKKIICYSGDDIKTSPDDPQYLDDIAEALIKAGLENEYQLLLRRCPVDLSGRFEAVVKKHRGLIKEATPLWLFKNSSAWSMVYPSRDDVSLLVSTAYYSDIVVNVGSTMAFDFAMFDKPCIFINYDQKHKKNPNWSVKTIYQYQHFRSMPNSEAVIWLNHPDEIAEKLRQPFNSKAMKQWETVVIADYKNASVAIRKQLNID
ncbi:MULTISPECIES: UDP-glycosyltransferase [Flavobacterium]|uniref:UDP-glycosyltransferase n=1 Tax=Flavobacterium hankyongi TaxID=1176532 RepID=A0ABP9A2C9_9FLAO|nr:UDP-glycosyltransferase [Flavobacterium sp. N1846]